MGLQTIQSGQKINAAITAQISAIEDRLLDAMRKKNALPKKRECIF